MANDYLKSKWRTWFSWFDRNKGGKVCNADLELALSKFMKLHGFEGAEKEGKKEAFTKWWKEYILWDRPEVTADEFINLMDEAFKADKVKFKERMQKCENEIADSMATSKDGYMTEEDHLMMFKAGGHEDDKLDKKFFAAFNPVDGKVPLKATSDLWVEFLTSEDSSKPDIVKQAFDGGL